MAVLKRDDARDRRHRRLRTRIAGTAERPRLAIYRSLSQIYAQVIDDLSGRTIAAASSLGAAGATGRAGSAPAAGEARAKGAGKTAVAAAVGAKIAERAKAAGIEEVIFDRGGYRYHGRVKALADAARSNGLRF